jgi:hypothetical protein
LADEEKTDGSANRSADAPEVQPKDNLSKQRNSLVDGVFSSVKHLQEAHATGHSTIRKSDRISQITLFIAVILIAAAQMIPGERLQVSLAADFMMAVALCTFLALRFGVIRTLLPRQTILVWQLIVGSFLLGLFLAFNLKMFALLQSGLSLTK